MLYPDFEEFIDSLNVHEDLIRAKQAAGRPQDLADLDVLKRMKPKPPRNVAPSTAKPTGPRKKQRPRSKPD